MTMAMFRRLERASPIGIRYLAPSAALRSHIAYYCLLHADLAEVSEPVRADLPHLRFSLSGNGSYRFGDGEPVPAPDIALVGPTTAAFHYEGEGPLLTFCVSLLPEGWSALVREDAALFRDRLIDASDMFAGARDALDHMRNLPMASAMTSTLDALLLKARERAPRPVGRGSFIATIDDWLLGAASPALDDLLARLDLSARQIERLASRLYGAPPKLLARKYRALRSVSLLRYDPARWAAGAVEPFYDQSHMIREIRHFTGVTPRRLQVDPPLLTRLSLERRLHPDIVAPLAAMS